MIEQQLESVVLLSRNRFRALVDAIPEAVCVLDRRLRVRAANLAYASQLGKHPSEVIGSCPGYAPCAESDLPCLAPVAREAFERGTTALGTFQLLGREGEELWLEISATPLPTEDGLEPAVAVVLRNVTAQRKMEQQIQQHSTWLEREVHARTAELEEALRQLRETEALKRDLFNMIVHDLKAPLAAVMANLDMLELSNGLHEEQRVLVESARIGGDDMALMIGNLLDLERMEAGRLRLDFHPVNPADLARAAMSRLQAHARLQEVELSLDLEEDVPPMILDQSMFDRVLRNLLMNAIEHSPAGEVVRVTLRFNGESGRLEVSVEDRGPGVPEEERRSIFQKFRQGRGHASGSGSGLGLAFCKMAVEAHHGTIFVEPADAAGSRFRVILPLLGIDGKLP